VVLRVGGTKGFLYMAAFGRSHAIYAGYLGPHGARPGRIATHAARSSRSARQSQEFRRPATAFRTLSGNHRAMVVLISRLGR